MTRSATARLAGLLYFATLPTAGFAYGYVAFMPKNDPAALVSALEAGRHMLNWTILFGAAGFIDYLVMAALFHRLLAPAGKVAADLLVLLAPPVCRSRSPRSRSVWTSWRCSMHRRPS